MAYNDALFQLGMDLTRSSTAQKEDHCDTAFDTRLVEAEAAGHDQPAKPLKDALNERPAARTRGTHLIVDLVGARRLGDLKHVERTLVKCAEASGSSVLHVHLQPVKTTGAMSGVAVLPESHISIHGWPVAGEATLDVFVSGAAKPEPALEVLRQAFRAKEIVVMELRHGEAPAELSLPPPVRRSAGRQRLIQKAA